MLTVLEVLRRSAEFFAAKGIGTSRLDAELLVGHALGLPRMQLYLQFERPLQDAEVERIRALVRRRAAREPLQYIIGEVDFCGLKLKVDPRALIPRPETERLVEILVERCVPAPATVLDLGTGTGAIALALAAAWPAAAVTAVDRSESALALARENAERTSLAGRVSWIRSSWFGSLPPGAVYACIVANPPYLSAGELAASMPEVKDHEPADALVGGDDGLEALRTILGEAPIRLAAGGCLMMETGPTQHETLGGWVREAGWAHFESICDLAMRPRFFLLSGPPGAG